MKTIANYEISGIIIKNCSLKYYVNERFGVFPPYP